MFQLTKEEYDVLSATLMSQSGISNTGRGGRRKLPYVFTEQGVAMLSAVLKSETAVKVSIEIMNAFVKMRRFLTANAQVFERHDTLELKQSATDKKVENVLNAIESKQIQPKQGVFFDGQVFDASKFVADLIRTAKRSIVLIDNYVDDSVIYHLGKKWFAFSKMEMGAVEMLKMLEGRKGEWRDIALGDFMVANVKSIGRDYHNKHILYLDTGTITCNRIESYQSLPLSEAPSRAKKFVKEEDIIYFSVCPNQLRYAFIKGPQENLVVYTGFVVISCDKENLYRSYLYYYLTQKSSIKYLHSIAVIGVRDCFEAGGIDSGGDGGVIIVSSIFGINFLYLNQNLVT